MVHLLIHVMTFVTRFQVLTMCLCSTHLRKVIVFVRPTSRIFSTVIVNTLLESVKRIDIRADFCFESVHFENGRSQFFLEGGHVEGIVIKRFVVSAQEQLGRRVVDGEERSWRRLVLLGVRHGEILEIEFPEVLERVGRGRRVVRDDELAVEFAVAVEFQLVRVDVPPKLVAFALQKNDMDRYGSYMKRLLYLPETSFQKTRNSGGSFGEWPLKNRLQ